MEDLIKNGWEQGDEEEEWDSYCVIKMFCRYLLTVTTGNTTRKRLLT